MAKAGRGDDQYMVRFPEGLRNEIKAAAEQSGRSMNTEIVERLQNYDMIRWRLDQVMDERDKLEAKVAAANEALADQKATLASLQQLFRENFEDAQRDQETTREIEDKFNQLQAQRVYLESLRTELLALARQRNTPEVSDVPLTSDLFDRLFGDMRERLDRIEQKVDGQSRSEG